MKDIQEIRQNLDIVDSKLIELFEQRFALSKEVAEYKRNTGKQVLDKDREEQKLSEIDKLVNDDEYKLYVEDLFIRIMDLSRKLQYKMISTKTSSKNDFTMIEDLKKEDVKVVYQGVKGAYSHEAMIKVFGENVDSFNVEYFKDAMIALQNGQADYAVLPIENSSAGIVSEIYDLLTYFDNYIVEETNIKISHALLGLPEAQIEDIKTIYSHPQALMQCKKYLEEHRDWEQIAQYNTAMSAIKVSEDKDKSQAAIASTTAAKLYGLKILQENINYCDINTTKFIIISNKRIYRKNANKIMICFELPHESGSLYKLLTHFIYNKLNMTKIESRPIPNKRWEYRFFVEFEGSLQDTGVENAIYGIKEEAMSFKVLGNY